MEMLKRAYYLPKKLVDAFNGECDRKGYVREKVVAAAIYAFMESDPNARAKAFERLNSLLRSRMR